MRKRNWLSSVPFSRLLIYLIICACFPILMIGYHYLSKCRDWDAVQTRLVSVYSLSETKARKQHVNILVRNTFGDADQFYLENQIESLLLLKKEREALEKLLHNPNFIGNEAAEKRFASITSTANRFELTHGGIQNAEGIQESLVMLVHPVEIDTQDLKEILTRIEGNRKGKPQLIFTDFKLLKKAQRDGNEVFELNMKLLKREFS